MQTKKVIPSSGWDAKEWLSIIVITIGVALISTGITIWVKDTLQGATPYLIVGVLACLIPIIITVVSLKTKKLQYEYPTATDTKLSKGDNVQVALFVFVFICLIVGFGVALSCILITIKYGWGVAEDYLLYGLLGAGAPMILFILLSSVFVKD
jgi:hypothetical protein